MPDAVVDQTDPVCTVALIPDSPFAEGSVVDNQASEDTNDNGILDQGEDLDGDGSIDMNMGVGSISFVAATNIELNTSFSPGDPSASFSLALVDRLQAGSATVRASDLGGNTCEVSVAIPPTPFVLCDADRDGRVSAVDIDLIAGAVGTVASGPNDPRDFNQDGVITSEDARQCLGRLP